MSTTLDFTASRQAAANQVRKRCASTIEAAVALAIRSPGLEKHYSAESLQLAEEQYGKAGLGLQQLLIVAAASNGLDVRPGERVTGSNLRGLLRAAFGDGPQASSGFSTISLSSGILANVANKEILMGYMEEDQAWREISAIKPVSNFYQHSSNRLLDNFEFEKVGKAGEIKHGSVGSERYTRQADTYAKMWALTRQDFLNDDLGAFADIRPRLGRGGAKKLSNVFWTAFMANHAAFFTAARTNYIEGATTNLGTDGVGLAAGIAAFNKRTSPSADGANRIGGRAAVLLVPPELEGNADVLFVNQNLGSVSNGDANIYAGKYKPVSVPQLSDSSFTGNSTTAWYLCARPGDLPLMAVSFLNGAEAPTIESADADFHTLGVQFRGYWDFGCDQAEALGGVKVKGAA